MKLFIAALILTVSANTWSREIRQCDTATGDFLNKEAMVILDLEAEGELSVVVHNYGFKSGEFNRFIVEGRVIEMASWAGQQADASASFDASTSTLTMSFVLPHMTLNGTFTNCVLLEE